MQDKDPQGICSENVFTRFFNAQISALRNFLYFKFGNDALADDLAQEAFVKLWQNCAEVRHPKSFVYTVARNAALNHIAAEKVAMKFRTVQADAQLEHATPEYLMEEDDFARKFDAAIAALTEAQRTALLLNRIEGKKYREIAEILGISVKAVEKRIHGALVAMREKIDQFR